MTISAKTLSAIQAAGQAIDAARAELAAATQAHAAQVMQAVAANPFGAENDHLINRWTAIARMSKSMQDMEVQCKAVFHAAAELSMDTDGDGRGHAPNPMRKAKPALIGHADIDLAPSDVQAKLKPGRPKAKPAAAKKQRQSKSDSKSKVKGNAAKVLDHLRSQLSPKRFTRVTQSDIATGAGIPNGSIGAALKQLTDKGLLSEGDKGHYKLA